MFHPWPTILRLTPPSLFPSNCVPWVRNCARPMVESRSCRNQRQTRSAESKNPRGATEDTEAFLARPHPRPSPPGRGRIPRRYVATPTRRILRLSPRSIAERTVPVSLSSSAVRQRTGLRSVSSPSPPPSPLGRGRSARCVFADPERLDSLQRGMRCSLSLRQLGVRGTRPSEWEGNLGRGDASGP